jgi:tetratricopeptide (TPR) repeat protein
LAFGSAAACGDKSQKESISFANEAVDAANQGRMTEAKELLEKATAAYRDNHNAWYNLGQIRDTMKQYEEAAEAYSEAARVKDDDAMYHYKLGKAYWMSNSASSAQSALERAVQLNAKLYNAQYHLGLVYDKQGKPKEAAEAWTAAAALNPMFGKPFTRLGMLYIKWDKLPQAISVLDQGRLNVRDGEDLTEIYYNLGLAYGKQGNWDKAIEAYSNAIQTRSSNLDALRQRGFAYAEKDDVANAMKDLKEFVDQGGNGDAFDIQAANQRLMSLTVAP